MARAVSTSVPSTPDMLATVHLTSAPGTNGTSANLPAGAQGCIVLSTESGHFVPWDNPHNLVSQQVEKAVDNAVAVFFLPLLFLLNVSTNTINMLVFWRHGVRERINLCLFCLSLTDLLYMCHSFLYNVDKLYQPFTGKTGVGVVYEFFISNSLLFLRGFNYESGFLSMLIACERCLCVYSPLRAQNIFKTRTTLLVIFLSTLVHHGFLFIAVSRWGTACVFDPETNSTSKAIYPTKFYLDNQQVVDLISGIVIGLLVPFSYVSIIFVTTVMTLVRLRELATWREQASSVSAVSSREIALTRMLMGISVLYVVCSFPNLTLGILLLSVPDMSTKGRYYNAFNLLVSFYELCTYINASFNFFVYFFLGSKYKETLGEMFVCCRRKSGQLKVAAGKGYHKSANISNDFSTTPPCNLTKQ